MRTTTVRKLLPEAWGTFVGQFYRNILCINIYLYNYVCIYIYKCVCMYVLYIFVLHAGFLCPVHTPDGAPCGLLNHLAAACQVRACTHSLTIKYILETFCYF